MATNEVASKIATDKTGQSANRTATTEVAIRTSFDNNLSRSKQIRLGLGILVLLGVISGVVCGFAKLGWEVPFPPRTALRDATNPPQQLLQQLGFSPQFTHTTYSYNGNPRPIISFMVHFGFSIFFMVLYCIVAESKPKITLWQGAAYGLVLWVAFHVVIMPAIGTVPAPWHQPPAEHLSEIFGHMFCFWVAELARHDLRTRILMPSV
jgi:putative membrane protein